MTDESFSPIDLAHVAPFPLGPLDVSPATCEVVWEGGRETLQPRIMQVLVALAEHRGAVVSHDDLIATCWEGRIVGEDAIHRSIGRLRDLARRTNGFTIETLPRVGYRLDVNARGSLRPFRPGRPRTGLIITLGLLGILGLAGGISLRLWRAGDNILRVQVATIQAIGGMDAPIFAQTLQGDLVNVLNQSGVQTGGDGRSALLGWLRKPDVILRGAVSQIGPQLKVHLTLEDVPTGVTLWSERFARDVTSAGALADAAAGAATETIYTIREFQTQTGLHPDTVTIALHIRGASLVRNPQFLREGSPREIYEQVVAHAPEFAAGHAMLALALANEGRLAAPDARPALFGRSDEAARTAIEIEPAAAGAAYDALFLSRRTLQPYDIAEAEDRLLEGLSKAPDFAFLSMRECRLLADVGRGRDALPYCQRALAQRPLAGAIGYSYANALNVAGDVKLAQAAIERAARFDPDQAMTRRVRTLLAVFDGSLVFASGLLRDAATQPPNISPHELALLQQYIDARRSGQQSDLAASAKDMRTAAHAGMLSPEIAVMALTSLGHLDDAFAVMKLPSVDEVIFTSGSAFLFGPVTAPLRADPRFWDVAERLGLAKYWLVREKWPDICGRDIPLAACRTETERVLSSHE